MCTVDTIFFQKTEQTPPEMFILGTWRYTKVHEKLSSLVSYAASQSILYALGFKFECEDEYRV